jgi:hypothetical protein
MSEGPLWKRVLDWWLLAVPLLLGVLLRIPDVFYHFRDWDEASMMAQAWSMTRGQVLYRDVPQIHGALNIALFVPFFTVLPPDAAAHAIKVFNLLLVVLGALLMRSVAQIWFGDRLAALAAAAIFAFSLGRRWALSSYGEFYTPFLILLSARFLFQPVTGLPLNSLLVGGLWGTAFCVKQIAAFDAIGLYGAWRIFGGPGARTWTATLNQVVGGVGAVGVVGLWFVGLGGGRAWVDSTLLRPLLYTGLGGGAGGTAMSNSLLAASRGFVTHLRPAVIATAGGVVALLASRRAWGRRLERGDRLFLGTLVWAATVFAGIWLTGRFYEHYLLQLVPALSLTSVFLLTQLPGGVRKVVIVVVLAGLLGDAALASGRQVVALGRQAWVPDEVRQSRQLARAIRASTAEHDRIFLYKVWNLDLFFLAERLPAAGITMFIDMVSEHSRDPALEARKQRELLEDPPALILVNPRGWKFNTAEAFFQNLLHQKYVSGATVAGVHFYHRRE